MADNRVRPDARRAGKETGDMSHDAMYEMQQIKTKLIGATIVSALVTPSTDRGYEPRYFGFVAVRDGVRLEVWIDSDQEGNDCGHLDIKERWRDRQ